MTGLHSTAAGWLRETLPEGTRIEDLPPEPSRWFPDAGAGPTEEYAALLPSSVLGPF